MIYRIAWWTGIVAGFAGVLAASFERWLVAIGLGLLAVVCAVIVWNPRKWGRRFLLADLVAAVETLGIPRPRRRKRTP